MTTPDHALEIALYHVPEDNAHLVQSRVQRNLSSFVVEMMFQRSNEVIYRYYRGVVSTNYNFMQTGGVTRRNVPDFPTQSGVNLSDSQFEESVSHLAPCERPSAS